MSLSQPRETKSVDASIHICESFHFSDDRTYISHRMQSTERREQRIINGAHIRDTCQHVCWYVPTARSLCHERYRIGLPLLRTLTPLPLCLPGDARAPDPPAETTEPPHPSPSFLSVMRAYDPYP
ncbi:hypothetical protein CRENBAI_012110 [Crenichthys baileyi]|uniref:Uncharacterized protein n=1 Tax=Crenichthys baileyi TaxID=28760 RepID=A0AAV9S724_9TELE